ncbi:fluoride efflux transporter CrcB [Brevundimonas subvibrioides]|uniref:fluoride efflux transporter CrcB n=1 Tax=Brevundimonas subvibrioides TaxID=74313 RepID=UPI0022B2D9E4|nr:fluoride efflux transporter CrcB [Brevundimonas subvibrioides]
MTRFLLVAIGGALGSMARYGVGLLAGRLFPAGAWPWGTLTVNVVGGLAMGLLVGWIRARSAGHFDQAPFENLRVFAAVGLLGGFTTFSAFSLETVSMIERRDYGLAAAYVGLSVVLAIAAVFAGLMVARRAFGVAA